MKKNLFAIAALVLMMFLMTACHSKEVMTPTPTVPNVTIPAENDANSPLTTVLPDPTAPAATATPAGTDAVQ